MKHIHFDVESDGFYGAYWACKDGSDCAVIAMLGDDPEDYMVRSAVKWLLRLGVKRFRSYEPLQRLLLKASRWKLNSSLPRPSPVCVPCR